MKQQTIWKYIIVLIVCFFSKESDRSVFDDNLSITGRREGKIKSFITWNIALYIYIYIYIYIFTEFISYIP